MTGMLRRSHVALVAVVVVFSVARGAGESTTAPASHPSNAGDKIKVGIVLVDPADQVFYRKMIGAAVKNLEDPQIELFALTTVQMTQEPTVAALLNKSFDEQHRLDATDAATVKGMQVIVAYFAGSMQDEMVGPITEAVEQGTGLLIQQSIRSHKVDTREQLQKLDGFDNEEFAAHDKVSTCRIVAQDHPLVQDLKQAYPDGRLEIDYRMGLKGPMHGTPLLVTTSSSDEDVKDETLIAEAKSGERFCPLYVGEVGKGKVVGCQWYSAGKAFRAAAGNKFHVHCVQWLAGKPVK